MTTVLYLTSSFRLAARKARLALLLAFALPQFLQAQRLGGIPDPTFNVADSGLAMPQLHVKNMRFWPGGAGSLYTEMQTNYRLYNQLGRRAEGYVAQYDKALEQGSSQSPYYYPAAQGFLMQTKPMHYALVKRGSFLGNGVGIDSVSVIPDMRDIARLSHFYRPFYFPTPLYGYPSYGLTELSPSRCAFWLTSHASDTLRPHNQTTVCLLDTGGRYQNLRVTLAGFRAELSAEYQGKLYLLGRTISNDTVPAGTEIRVLDAATLQVLASPFTGLGNLLRGPAQVFAMQAGEKALIAGSLDNGGGNGPRFGYQAVRITATGLDAGYAVTRIESTIGAYWNIDSLGILRGVGVNANVDGRDGTATLVTVGANGGTSETFVPFDPTWPGCHPIMYHPAQKAFLFETSDIYATIPPNLNISYQYDTAYGKRYRFYVSYEGKTWPLINHAGVGYQGEYVYIHGAPAHNKLLVSSPSLQTNGSFLPGLAVLNADGTLDTIFKGLLQLPVDQQSRFVYVFRNQAFMTSSGKILMYMSTSDPNQNNTRVDTLARLLPSGKLDYSYRRPYVQLGLQEKRGGGYLGGRFTPTTTATIGLNASVVELDAEGNEVREYGNYTPNGSYPDTTAEGINRTTTVMTVPNLKDEGALWLSVNWSVWRGVGNVYNFGSYYVRMDSLGRSRIYKPIGFTIVDNVIKLEQLPGRRYRLTGAFFLHDTTLAGRYVNVIETDSVGNLDVAVRPIAFRIPDAYGYRGNNFIRPRYTLPDGRVISLLDRGSRFVIRHYADGRHDPSFLPIPCISLSTTSVENLGDRLYLSGYNFNTKDYESGMYYYSFGSAAKNGVAAFRLSQRPDNTGFVLGRVEQVTSPATGCAPTGPRQPARGMVLVGQPGNHIAIADTGGNYTMAVQTGVPQAVSQRIENNFLQRQVCPAANAARTVTLAGNGAAVIGQDFVNQTFDCPRLDLKVLSPRFRLCSKSVIRLQYQNDGVADEPAARIRLNLPQEVRLLTSNHPFTRDADSTYVFDLGRLHPGNHGELILQDTIACLAAPDSMARACYSARIEPLSLCSDIDAGTLNWDGAWLDAEARYLPELDKVRVVIRNRGASMRDSTPVSVTSGGYAFLHGKQKLALGDSVAVLVPPAIQGSVSVLITQPVNCPLGSNSSLFQSGRGTARAFLNFGSGLLETYTAQACPSFRYSFDPNDKTVEPAGNVEPGTELHYTIYFENYGNDTAYAVSIEDSLPQGLDVTTVKLGASSHPCQVAVEGTVEQPVLFFYFNPIKLTGKRQDSVLSKGQVEFTMRTRPDVARGTLIPNRAHIYFDRNAAVTTGYTNTRIAQEAVTAVRPSQSAQAGISIYPNPAQGRCRIEVSGAASQAGHTLRLLSAEGKVMLQQPLNGQAQLQVEGLAAGIYTVLVDGFRPERLIIVR